MDRAPTHDAPDWLVPDALAGVVDLFGWLTPTELRRAVDELAFKRRETVEVDTVASVVDDAVDAYVLVSAPPVAIDEDTTEGGLMAKDTPRHAGALRDGDQPLAVGPVAFPTLPEGAVDLPHILDVDPRTVTREALADAVLERLSDEAVASITADDPTRLETLADVTYDLEAWAAVDVGRVRDRIVAELDDS
jgi:hypothetical protein